MGTRSTAACVEAKFMYASSRFWPIHVHVLVPVHVHVHVHVKGKEQWAVGVTIPLP